MSSSRGGSSNGGGAAVVQSIPAASRKMVQSLKEIVNCPEPEIYSMLKDCNMDPNEAVNRLLAQDPFHEVKSKREKKKETKDTTESRPRGVSSTSNRGSRSGTDRYGGRGASTHFSSSESGGLHGKGSYKNENGTGSYISSSASGFGMAGSDTNQRPLALSDSLGMENKASTVSAVDGTLSASQTSGYQPAWLGVPGQKSMADIVKMGRPQSKAFSTPNPSYQSVNHNLVPPPLSTASHHDVHSSEDYASKVSEIHHQPEADHVSPDDEWPLIEQPQAAGMHSVLEPHADSELNSAPSNLPFERSNQYLGSQTDEVQAIDDTGFEERISNHVGSASVSSRKMQEDNSGSASLFDNDLYKNMSSYQSQDHAFEHQEVDEGDVSVSSVNANFQQLGIQEEDHRGPPEEDGPSVVIPNHLQVQTADCSHLSFGSFGSGMNAGYSGPFASRTLRNDLEETPAEVDASSVGHSDNRNSEYYTDEPVRTSENLAHRTGATAGSYDSPSASQPEVLKQESPEAAHGNQYTFPSSAPGYTFENPQMLNTSFPHPQTSSQMQNLTPFSNVMQQAYTNQLPSTQLAANGHPVRESDLSYSPFPVTQSMPAKYGNSISSISGSTISMAEALKTVGFSSSQPTQQTPPGNTVATGPTLPQHLAVHPYSQPALPLGPFTNMISYPFLPQSYTYMPPGFQQAFAGNSTYHQSLAAVLPQYKNSVSVSSLPQSAAVPSGYGAFGSSSTIPGNYPMNPPAGPAGSTISYDDVLSSQYKDNNHLLSLQQNENSAALWLQGAGSRTMSAVPPSTYYSFQGQNQQPGGFRQAQQPSQNYGTLGYPNFYHSQTGMSLEHQQPQNPRDGSLGGSQGQSKQSQQIWQNSY